MEAGKRKQTFLGDNSSSKMILLTDTVYPLIKVTFGGADSFREPMEIDAEQFIAVKGFKAKGKRISTWAIDSIEELEPVRQPEQPAAEEPDENVSEENLDPDSGKSEQQIIDEMTGQLNLFSDDDV